MQTAKLLELLAARQSGSGNAAVQDLLARLRGGAGAQTLQDTLGRLAQTNPMIGLLAQQWGAAAGSSNHAASVVEGEAVEIAGASKVATTAMEPCEAPCEEPDAVSCDATAEFPALSDRIRAELAVCRERVDRCAAALGACGLCWGTNPGCRACRGRGRPGFSLPDETLFDELILPAVRMMRNHRAGPATTSLAPQVPMNERSARTGATPLST
jgi:hypothetical protein